ncbi:MAG: DUF4199 domain-containing protein, partial [Catalinimonas sp.]
MALGAGALGGLGCFLFYMILHLTGLNPLWAGHGRDARVLLIVAALAGGMAYYRRRQPERKLHLWEGALLGLITLIFFTAVTCVGLFLLMNVVAPDLLPDYLRMAREQMIDMREQHIDKFGEQSFAEMI